MSSPPASPPSHSGPVFRQPNSSISAPPLAAASPEPDANDSSNGDDDVEDQGGEAMTLPLAASVILTSLPRNTSAALANAGDIGVEKVIIRLQPVGSAPALKQRKFTIAAKQRFSAVIAFLRKKLAQDIRPGEGVFCYVNSVFAPNPDEIIGSLWRCFKTGDELVVSYAKTPAFG